ncbi:fructose-bisphosphatase [Candidatus Roizmanbacteria bacterium RIFCSPHIGHO2_02_FULL_37_13b]|uniref:Fructose-1,6-bisphosphatase class 1 n=1 Tax=Candidatus Roizmanbacteria bacterium RIFCSPLOWO2_02_FULL_36_11 TaxID=1802071 RepID=A0A1F7JCE9_9BACT|nr:MAG: fructose-bisphosphatase [Candidatus Roizmanbacteria bacterium RIFCSPHIGHO2_02_FULL_37_13b]OGK53286.1 MAG: fructose-bisphosphatase [Candidatus Roizmanbacteria bacterium RIFCSPLOWO2_02_FULL_36_11]
MLNKTTTLTEFLLQDERRFKKATGNFTLLLTAIENAVKIIASHVKKSGLVDILGSAGTTNIYDEEVQKLDKFSNDILVETLTKTGHVSAIVTEELEKPELIKTDYGEYVVYIDPLDGSSNIDVNLNVGTIFSIHRKPDNIKSDADLLLKGSDQVAAGYVVYGPSVMFIYTCGNGVNGFTLDPSIGSFLLSHPDMKVPETGKSYAINESYYHRYPEYIQKYLDFIKKEDEETGKPYTLRYASAMIADIHRVLIKGGIFLYPENSKSPNGKLRLMYEVNPMSYIVTQASGSATSQDNNPLEIQPKSLDERTPIVLGSKKMVSEFLSFLK